jgi:hypothetical protein
MTNILRGICLTSLLIFLACGGSDNGDDNRQPVERKWVFTLEGQTARPGDTIHIEHSSYRSTITWEDENASNNSNQSQYNTSMYDLGRVEYDRSTSDSYTFISCPSFNQFILSDRSFEPIKEYVVYVDITPKELKGKFDFTGITSGYYDNIYYNNKYIEGPFLQIYINEELRPLFITKKEVGISKDGTTVTQDAARDFFKIKAFGSDRETCYPSSKDWGWYTEYKPIENSNAQKPDGATFYGKVNYSNVDYWFLQFEYGDYSYEVRKYKGSDNCLWNGEWE